MRQRLQQARNQGARFAAGWLKFHGRNGPGITVSYRQTICPGKGLCRASHRVEIAERAYPTFYRGALDALKASKDRARR